jgi:hypothetical protein
MYTQKDGVAHQSIVPDDQMLYFTPELGIRHPQDSDYVHADIRPHDRLYFCPVDFYQSNLLSSYRLSSSDGRPNKHFGA